MEFKDYLAVLRRRWLVAFGVFVGLQTAFTGYLYLGEKPRYVAATRIGIRDERRPFTPAELQPFQYEIGGYGYYTKEALLSTRQVFDAAAAVYLAVKDRRFKSPEQKKRWWRDPASEVELAAWIRDGGMARVETDSEGRIVTLELDEEKIAETARLLQSVNAEKPDDRMQIMRLTAVSDDPEKATLLANSFAKGAVLYSRSESQKLLSAIERSLQGRLTETERKIQALSTRPIAELSRETERRLATLTERQEQHEREMDSKRLRHELLLSRIRELAASEHLQRGPVPDLADDPRLTSPVLERLRSDLQSLQTEMSLLLVTRSPESREVQRLRDRGVQLGGRFREELDRVRIATIRQLTDESEELWRAIENHREARDRRIEEIEKVKQDQAALEPERRKLDQLNQDVSRYRDMLARIESVRALQQGYYTIEEVATDAARSQPRWPRMALLLGLISLALAAAAAFLVEYADSTLYTDYDVRRYVNVPCIALVEDVGKSSPLILQASPRDPLSEIFNMIATLVRTYLLERAFKLMSICSAIPREGKTTVACNLAVALARKGLRVALVDADLRIPQVHESFGVDNATGLSTILRGEVAPDSDPMTYMRATSVETLKILTAGPISDAPAQILESSAMVEVAKRLRESYDVVLFDTPPITSVGDALSLSRLVDTNLMVIGSGLCNRRVASWAKQLMANVKADICGAVLNFARRRQGASYYYYYYYSPSKSVRSRE